MIRLFNQFDVCLCLPWCMSAAAAALCLSLAGCGGKVETTQLSDSRPFAPEPRPQTQAPEGATADRLVIQVSPKPRDTDGNGYPDTIELLAYLFDADHPTSIYEEGDFVFTLHPAGQSSDSDAEAIRTWRLSGEEVEDAKRGRSLYGLTYAFKLSLLEEGGDRFPAIAADLTARFEPADGRPPVRRGEIHRLQIGR